MNKQLEEDLLDTDSVKLDFSTVLWTLQLAWKVNPAMFTVWILLQLFSSVFPAIFTGMISSTIDAVGENVSAGLGISSVVGMLLALAVIMIGTSIFDKLPNIFWMKLNNDFNIGIQRKMGEFMRTVPVRYFDDARTSKIMSIAQRREKEFGYFIGNFMEILRTVIYIISMLVLSIKTSWILVVVMVIYTAFVLFLGTRSAKEAYAADKELEEDFFFNDYYMNMAMKKNPKDIRLLSMSDFINKRWIEHRKKILDTDNKLANSSERSWSFVELISSVCKFILLFAGLFLLKEGQLTLGSLTVFVSVLSQIGNTCLMVGYVWKRFYLSGCDMKFKRRMFEWDFSSKRPLPEGGFAAQTKPKEGEKPIVFELQNVDFSYEENKKVLDDISFCIHEGESVALVGENGAGKSTLVKLLLGIYEPDSGELYYKGENYRDIDMSSFVKDIGVVFQDFVHFELLARENIAFGDITKVKDDEALNHAAKLGGADKIISKLPKGLDTYLGRWYEKEGGEMSGGEWQRMAVSRAYISDRKILIMDEPAAALDPIAEMEQFSRIQDKLQNRTSVLISHRIGFARLADRIIVLQNGKIVENGVHEELMKNKGLYYEMFYNQASWYQNGGAVNE